MTPRGLRAPSRARLHVVSASLVLVLSTPCCISFIAPPPMRPAAVPPLAFALGNPPSLSCLCSSSRRPTSAQDPCVYRVGRHVVKESCRFRLDCSSSEQDGLPPQDPLAADNAGEGGDSGIESSPPVAFSSADPSAKEQEDVRANAELPLSSGQQVEQAASAVWKAQTDGKSRQILRLSLPLIGATEMDDWPGGDRQRYKACGPMVKNLLLGSPTGEGATIFEQILDESDAVGLMQLQCREAKDDVSAMIFPTTDTLDMQKQVTNSAGSRLVLLVNPAWKTTADFGFFGAGEANQTLTKFDLTYSLQSLVVYGYTLRLLYAYPGPWRLFFVGEDTGTRELLGSWDECPPNREVERVVFAKKGKPSAGERVKASRKLFADGM